MLPKTTTAIVGLLAVCAATDGPPRTVMPPGTLVGITVPNKAAAIAPEQAGKIVDLRIRDGDRVKAGDVMFQLNSTLEQLEVDRLQAIVDSDLSTRRAKTTLALAEQQTARIRDLHERDIKSERELQIQEHELGIARLQVEQAELDHKQTKNQLAQAEERLAQRTIASPFDGIVTEHYLGNGDVVEKFIPVVEVMSLDPLWIEFECPWDSRHLFQKGGKALVAPAMAPDDTRIATVLLVSLKANASSHSFMVRASVPNNDLTWRTGQKMTIEPVATENATGPASRPGK